MVKLERDKAGQIIKEWQDEHWVVSDYDANGNRLQVTSSFVANILSKSDKMGQVTHMVAYQDKEKPWIAKMEYNIIGQEILRQVSGGVVNSFAYDGIRSPERRVRASRISTGWSCGYIPGHNGWRGIFQL